MRLQIIVQRFPLEWLLFVSYPMQKTSAPDWTDTIISEIQDGHRRHLEKLKKIQKTAENCFFIKILKSLNYIFVIQCIYSFNNQERLRVKYDPQNSKKRLKIVFSSKY